MTLTKDSFRRKCMEKMQKLGRYNKVWRDAELNRRLMQSLVPLQRRGKKLDILYYYPLKNEGDVLKSLHFLRKKHNIYTPFMEGKSFKMVPFRLPLYKKRFGILESGNSSRNIKKIDIAIVPAVGVDGNFQRIGYGKGMYDRFFQRLDKKPYTIFVQPNLCKTQEIICDAYDISCDLLITPWKIEKNRTKGYKKDVK